MTTQDNKTECQVLFNFIVTIFMQHKIAWKLSIHGFRLVKNHLITCSQLFVIESRFSTRQTNGNQPKQVR